jgi:signal transduction histidine kinase/CheY-like chemotaxis protein
LGLWWVVFSGLSFMYGKAIRFDQYFLAVLLVPFGLFSKKSHIIIGVSVTLAIYFAWNFHYIFAAPIVETPEPFATYRYFINGVIQVGAIIAIVSYFMNQNRENEEALTEEVKKHIQTTEELEEANHSKDKFFSIIAHDLKGPIGNFANILGSYEPEEIPKALYKHLREASHNTYHLLQDLLTWARSKKGQIEYSPQDFAVSDLFDKVQRGIKLSLKEKNLIMKIENSGAGCFAYADYSSVETILRNLLANAVKFTPGGGMIKLGCETWDSNIIIYVEDDGIGIPGDKINRLFKIGETNISSPGTNNETGTGVGLLLCKEFALANGGDVFVKSEEGKGSRFWITLPKGKKTVAIFEEEKIDYTKLRALVVEDNYLNMQTTGDKLKEIGMAYEIAEDGEQAIQLGTSKKYNIIFMDISLPKCDGITANKAIREVYRDARIVALTSFDKAEILDKDAGVIFDGYLKKPLDPEELIEIMQFVAIKKDLSKA